MILYTGRTTTHERGSETEREKQKKGNKEIKAKPKKR